MPMRLMKVIPALVATAGVLVTAPGFANEQAATLAVVDKFVTSFGTGDDQAMLSTCGDSMTIIDDVAPHIWQGREACRDWKRAVDAFLRDTGETQVRVTLGTPVHNDITGDRAYIVVPLVFNYIQDGRPVVDTGSMMTVALKKSRGSWRMSGWTCTEHP